MRMITRSTTVLRLLGVSRNKQLEVLIFQLGAIKSLQKENKHCRKHDGNMEFMFVSCVSLRKATVSSLHSESFNGCLTHVASCTL